MGVGDKTRRDQLESCRSFGRIRGVLFGFLLLVLPFFPLGEAQGKVMFVWDLFAVEGEGKWAGIAALLGSTGLGLFLILFSIAGSGLVRGFLQAFFAAAYLGVVIGGLMKLQLVWTTSLDLKEAFQNPMTAGLVGAFLVTVICARLKIFHPRRLFPRFFGFLAGGALIALVFVPPSLLGRDGASMFDTFRALIGGPDYSTPRAVLVILLLVMGFFSVTQVLPWRSGLRSRLVLFSGFLILLYPLVEFLCEVVDRMDSINLINSVHLARIYVIGFLALWALIVGLSAFLGNLLTGLNYNDKMLLANR